MGPEKPYQSDSATSDYRTKKCPHCYTYLPLDADTCTACRAKVGDVDKLGFASKPTDWRAYFIAAASIAVFAFFVYWAFFRDQG